MLGKHKAPLFVLPRSALTVKKKKACKKANLVIKRSNNIASQNRGEKKKKMSDELCFSVVSLSLYCYKEIIVKKLTYCFCFSGRCFLPKLTGPCKAYFPKYYFNHKTGKCEKFIYGGCMGNTNSFKTVTDCNDTCACKCPPVSFFFAYILVDNRL